MLSDKQKHERSIKLFLKAWLNNSILIMRKH